MRPLAALLVLAAPLAATAQAPSSKTQAETYAVQFPALPTVDSKELAVDGRRSVRLVTVRATDPKSGAVFSVTVADYPAVFAEVPADTLLDGVRDGLKGKDGLVKVEERVKGPHPGRAVRILAGRNTVRTRLLLDGTRLYQVTVSGQTRGFPDKLAEDFYASFELTR